MSDNLPRPEDTKTITLVQETLLLLFLVKGIELLH
jgi:hypothetical protein